MPPKMLLGLISHPAASVESHVSPAGPEIHLSVPHGCLTDLCVSDSTE